MTKLPPDILRQALRQAAESVKDDAEWLRFRDAALAGKPARRKRGGPLPTGPQREPRTFCYIRASTGKQEYTYEAQAKRLRTYMRSDANLPPAVEPYLEDHARSGGKKLVSRPAGADLVRLIQPGDHLLATSFNRIFRDLADGLAMIEWFTERGVTVHLLDFFGGMGLDTRSAHGRMVIAILAAVAAMERELVSERTRAVLQARREAGKPWCARPPLGWIKVPVGEKPNGKRIYDWVPDMTERRRCELLWRWDQLYSIPIIKAKIKKHPWLSKHPPKAGWNFDTIRVRLLLPRNWNLTDENRHGDKRRLHRRDATGGHQGRSGPGLRVDHWTPELRSAVQRAAGLPDSPLDVRGRVATHRAKCADLAELEPADLLRAAGLADGQPDDDPSPGGAGGGGYDDGCGDGPECPPFEDTVHPPGGGPADGGAAGAAPGGGLSTDG